MLCNIYNSINPHALKIILLMFVLKGGFKLAPGVSQLLNQLGTEF